MEKTCNYVTCDRGEELCGMSCYIPSEKACCENSLYPLKDGYECCSHNYIPHKIFPSDVCCGGKFHQSKESYKCCGRRYVQVRSL